jgi:hypothetical protein
VGSPWNDGRDSNNPGFGQEAQPDIADEHLSSFRDSFRPPNDRLSEQDYRPAEDGGTGSNAGVEDVTPDRNPREWPQGLSYPSSIREP